ncbi:hypothetical protein RFI_19188 [Reticulomyxa filosa]|uniref:Uncharacterized protein n=1 Tax=Reticulomyxa filosa TaxID=46433 RepID=X6MX95_RETFI|nr:hypothetical protein RFI_19188 [Reticulomyxa filosa]|eukprot:ETO18102.1 hypothetical protein RFI_19188 [Reticulomyxa filosa]
MSIVFLGAQHFGSRWHVQKHKTTTKQAEIPRSVGRKVEESVWSGDASKADSEFVKHRWGPPCSYRVTKSNSGNYTLEIGQTIEDISVTLAKIELFKNKQKGKSLDYLFQKLSDTIRFRKKKKCVLTQRDEALQQIDATTALKTNAEQALLEKVLIFFFLTKNFAGSAKSSFFVLILNAKKAKIRELTEQVRALETQLSAKVAFDLDEMERKGMAVDGHGNKENNNTLSLGTVMDSVDAYNNCDTHAPMKISAVPKDSSSNSQLRRNDVAQDKTVNRKDKDLGGKQTPIPSSPSSSLAKLNISAKKRSRRETLEDGRSQVTLGGNNRNLQVNKHENNFGEHSSPDYKKRKKISLSKKELCHILSDDDDICTFNTDMLLYILNGTGPVSDNNDIMKLIIQIKDNIIDNVKEEKPYPLIPTCTVQNKIDSTNDDKIEILFKENHFIDIQQLKKVLCQIRVTFSDLMMFIEEDIGRIYIAENIDWKINHVIILTLINILGSYIHIKLLLMILLNKIDVYIDKKKETKVVIENECIDLDFLKSNLINLNFNNFIYIQFTRDDTQINKLVKQVANLVDRHIVIIEHVSITLTIKKK